MTYESRSFFPTSNKTSPTEKLANIEEEKSLKVRPETSDSEDYSSGSHMKVSYWRFGINRPLTVVHWTLIFVQSAIDYPSAASFAKQFDYFNQPRASIQ